MVRSSIVACSLFTLATTSLANWAEPDDPNLSLLQLKAQKVLSNLTEPATIRSSKTPAGRERAMCPHEMTEAQKNFDGSFGCRGSLRAKAIKECSFWGEPHLSKTFPTQCLAFENTPTQCEERAFDVWYKPGLFRMAAADDGSWEIQVMNCGQYAGSLAVRMGKHVLEVLTPPRNNPRVRPNHESLLYFLDGEEYKGEFPIEEFGLFVDNTHHKALLNNGRLADKEKLAATMKDGWWKMDKGALTLKDDGGLGACIDDPGGQFYLDVFKGEMGNLNVLLQVQDGSYTTADGSASLCNVELTQLGNLARYQDWPVDFVKPEDSLFIGSGMRTCDYCTTTGWPQSAGHERDAQTTCQQLAPKEFSTFTFETMCKQKGISLESAAAACVHLKDNGKFFTDCQLDFCAADGNQAAVEDAEQEEHAEDPQPVCAIADDGCDPAAACCGALKDKAILDFSNVLQNNLCGDDAGARELRFGSVLTQQGQVMDLVVTPEEGHSCGKATNAKNGAKSDGIGRIGVQAGTEATFNFAFVKGGTDTPATPTSLMFSFLDIDQGKKDKQRESVEVCGAVNAVVTDNSELEQTNTGNCIKFTSTTHGTGKDNPSSADSMSDSQRARVVAFQIAGSSFQATLGVSKKGHNPRRFMFAGNPTVACVLK